MVSTKLIVAADGNFNLLDWRLERRVSTNVASR